MFGHMLTALKLLVAGLVAAFIGVLMAGFVSHFIFAKHTSVVAILIGVAYGIYVFAKLYRYLMGRVP